MKIIKKIVISVLVLFLLIIGTLIVVPVLFKDDIVSLVKEQANENLNAQVDFGNFDLSLLSTLPNFLFQIEDITVIGRGPFSNDTLVKMGKLSLKVDLKSVMDGNYVVESIGVSDLYAHAVVLQDSTVNWDVAISDTTALADEQKSTEQAGNQAANEGTNQEETPFKFELSNFSFTNINVVYDDRLGGVKAKVVNLNLNGDYQMDGDQMTLNTLTTIEGVTAVMDGVRLMNKVKVIAKANLEIDNEKSRYTFKDNEFALNNLKLGLDGFVAMPDQGIELDLKVAAKNNTFSEVLSLIPSVYKGEIQGVETNGDFSLTADLNGVMVGDQLPAFSVGFSVKNGFLKYPDLPESVENIQIELAVNNKTGVLDHTLVNLSLFHFEVAENPIDLKFFVKNIESDPNMKGEVKSKLNLESLAKAIPMEEALKGRLNADIEFAGQLSSIEQEQYEDFDLKGQLTLMDFLYQSAALPDVKIKNMHVNFSPKYFELGHMELTIGESDISGKGKVDNILPYVFKEDTIRGEFSLSSSYFNLNELMTNDSSSANSGETDAVVGIDEAGAGDSVSVSSSGVVEVPGNIDFVLNSSFKKIAYDNMPITDFVGQLVVKNSKVKFKDASLNILGGAIELDGTYSTQNPIVPQLDMDLSIKDMDIPIAFQTFNTVEKMAPIAQHAKGSFSTSLNLKGVMTENMDIDLNSLTGKGDLVTKDLVIEGHKLFDQLAKVLKNPKYKKLEAKNLKIKYEFKDGKVHVKPFDLKLGNSKAKIEGWNSFEQTLSYTFGLEIPREEFGGGANSLISSLEGQASKLGANVELGKYVLVDVLATGPVSGPKLKVVPKGMSGEGDKSMKDQAVGALKEAAKEKAKELKKKAQQEADKLKKEAEAKAKAEAERLQKEVKQKAKAEADKQKAAIQAKAKAKAEAEKKKQEEALKEKAKGLLKGW